MTAAAAIILLALLASDTPAPAAPEPETFLDLEKRFAAALLERDGKAVDSLLAEDLIHVGFEGQITTVARP